MADDARLVIELEAKIDKLLAGLSKANGALYGFAGTANKNLGAANSAWDKLFAKGDAGKALDKVFDRSRLAILNSGASQLRVFGSALEPLGGYGLVAAGGVAAFGAAAAAAIKAADWAEQLRKTATQLGLSTTELQRWDFAADATGVSTDAMRESLSGFNEKLGNVQSNLARTREIKAFQAILGPDAQAQVRQLRSVNNVLQAIGDKLSSLPAAERAGLAARLDLAPILPTLELGRDGIKAVGDEGERTGAVLSNELIEKGAIAAENMKKIGDVVRGNLSAAFLDLIPNIKSATTAIGDFLQAMTYDLQISEQELGDFGRLWLDMANLRLAKIPHDAGNLFDTTADGKVRPPQYGDDTILAMINARFANHPTAKQLVPDAPKKARGAHDDTREELKAADDAAAEAARELAEAQKGLTANIQARADAEKAANDAEAAKRQVDLKAQRGKLLGDKGIEGKASDAAQAQIEKAQADVETARVAKNQAIQREADFKIEDRQIEVHTAVVEALIAELDAQAQITTSKKKRAQLEAQALAARQQLDRDTEGTKLDRQVATGEITPQQRDQQFGALQATQGAQTASQQNQQFLDANPLAKFGAQASETYGDLGADFQDAAVKGLQSFNAGLANAVVNFKSLKQVGVDALKAIEESLIQSLLQKIEGTLIGSLFGMLPGGGGGGAAGGASYNAFAPPGMAAGGRISGPGGPRSDAIMIAASDGEFMVSSAATRANLPLLQAINSGRLPRFAAGGLVGSMGAVRVGGAHASAAPVHNHFDFTGAVVTQDLLDDVNARVRAGSDGAVRTSLAMSRDALPVQLRRRKLLSD